MCGGGRKTIPDLKGSNQSGKIEEDEETEELIAMDIIWKPDPSPILLLPFPSGLKDDYYTNTRKR